MSLRSYIQYIGNVGKFRKVATCTIVLLSVNIRRAFLGVDIEDLAPNLLAVPIWQDSIILQNSFLSLSAS